jgi:acetoin utilization protein AcuC
MHHAMADWAAGFCVYNDAAIAISWLLDNGYDRIAYVDVDAHHGDGVQHAFLGDPRVLTISLHQHPATLWPNTGWSSEVGSGEAEGTSINMPVLPGTVDSLWLRAFHAVVPGALAAFRPQILISQCGADSHREDPLADLALTVDGQRASYLAMRDLADRHCEGRWLAVGGGGYGLVRVVPRAWTHLIAAALDREIDLATAVPEDWRERVGALAPGVDLPTVMGEDSDVSYLPWDGPGGTPETGVASLDRALTRIDSAIIATRRSAFPLLGLDPEDPRD